ncbi:unnamed protein product [Sphagnum jensenii]|uniref:Two-component response regulator n=1 Tax=Sphagnum jensenii TaxID=128206 RepID=A0ABP1AIN0_9BRYO
MESQKQFLKLVEAKKQKALEKKEAPLKWEQRLEMASKAKSDSKSKERDEFKTHKRARKERSSESDADSDDSEERKKRKKHRKHKHSSGKHTKKHNHHDFDSSSEDSDESGSGENQRRQLHQKGGRKHHRDHSGSGSDIEEDHHPLKLSMWRKEHGSSSESFQSSDKGRSRSRKHKKEKDKPHSRSGHHHHHHRHQRHHNSDGKVASSVVHEVYRKCGNNALQGYIWLGNPSHNMSPHCNNTSASRAAAAVVTSYGKMEPHTDDFPAGLRILVVDDDLICLAILQKMLQHCSYQVTTCGRATRALELLREDKDKFDLVISDVYMPDMDGFRLLELVGLEMDLPVIMMSGNGETSVVMKGITHGACDYLLKPVRIEELRNIWQHVVRKLRSEPKEHSASFEEGERHKRDGAEDADNMSSATNNADGNWRNKKKKEAKEDEDDFELDNDDPSTLKKPRVVWSVELHQKFVSAVNELGIDKAVPKRILELMSVHGLTRENVASHLQKYRLYLKRLSSSPSEELTIQLLQQRAQQQGGGLTVNLPQATGILRPCSSDINLGQAGPMPSLVGLIPGTATGLSNMCPSRRQFGSSSSLSTSLGTLMQSSIAKAQNLNFVGSSGSSGCQPAFMSSSGMGSMGLNFPSSVTLDGGAVRTSLNRDQAMANTEQRFLKQEQSRDNLMCTKLEGDLMSNETTSEEHLNYYSRQSQEGMGLVEGDFVSDGFPLGNLYVK